MATRTTSTKSSGKEPSTKMFLVQINMSIQRTVVINLLLAKNGCSGGRACSSVSNSSQIERLHFLIIIIIIIIVINCSFMLMDDNLLAENSSC